MIRQLPFTHPTRMPRPAARRSRGSHCPFLILIVCLVQLASRFPTALAFVVGLGGASHGASSDAAACIPTHLPRALDSRLTVLLTIPHLCTTAASTSCPAGAARGRGVVAMADAGSSGSKDLLVVGMGTLGCG